MSDTAPGGNDAEMGGTSPDKEPPKTPDTPRSGEGKNSRESVGHPESPRTGVRLQTRRGVWVFQQKLDAEYPAGTIAKHICNQIEQHDGLRGVTNGSPIADKEKGVAKVSVTVDDKDAEDPEVLTEELGVARDPPGRYRRGS